MHFNETVPEIKLIEAVWLNYSNFSPRVSSRNANDRCYDVDKDDKVTFKIKMGFNDESVSKSYF